MKRSTRRARSFNHSLTTFEQLERRQLLASIIAGGSMLDLPLEATYVGAPMFFYKSGGFLTKPAAGDAKDIALNWVKNNPAVLSLAATDVRGVVVVDAYQDADTGIHRVNLKQSINGLHVANSDMTVSVMRDGRILSAGGNFVSLPKKIGAAPTLSVTAGLQKASQQLQLNLTQAPQVLQAPNGPKQHALLRAPQVSRQDIPAEVDYVVSSKGVRLAWEYHMQVPTGHATYTAHVDAATGELLFTIDHTNWFIRPGAEIQIGDGKQSVPKTIASGPTGGGASLTAPTYSATYNVYAFPKASPSDGPRTLETDPWDLSAPSPFGWQDTDGDDGAESANSVGNNVISVEDRDNNNTGGIQSSGGTLNPDGSGTLNFDTPLDFAQHPTTANNQLSAITNLFYWNNMMHDVTYRYGFTEVARNFQTNNYGRGGTGTDHVRADAQDGSGTNNANFDTPNGDGGVPRMQMYLFTTPDRDGDLDAEIIAHEYGHGISNRLVGNGAGISATQSRGMGEGWSDWIGLMYTLTDGSDTAQNAGYGVGTYALGEPPDGLGVRRVRYSNDWAINSQTFALYGTATGQSTQVHNTGELWCSALWDVNWNLIDKHGFNPDVTEGYPGTPTGNGNTLAIRLVLDGMKNSPANPTFVQARDGVLAADVALTGGQNQRELWLAFARRGLGWSANTTGSGSTTFNEAFDLPPTLFKPFVTSSGPGAVVGLPLTNTTINFSRPMDTTSFSVVDDVQSFSGPGGDMLGTITGHTWTNNQTLVINFTPTRVNGNYSMEVGPNILATDGSAMDQNGNDIAGEPDDSYAANFSKTGAGGPRVTSQTPSGAVIQPTFANIDVVFSEAMNQASFSVADDVVSFVGPGGTDIKAQVSGFSWQNATTLRITFPAQGADGNYVLTLAPTILANVDNVQMDQNSNTTPGEPVADRYVGTVALDRLPGPDGGGYEASPAEFQNINLVTFAPGVTIAVNATDDGAGTITLPAGNSFTYYGTTYTTLFPNANGLITFGTSTTSNANSDLTALPSQAAIAVLWDDWDTNATAAGGTDSAVLWKIEGNDLIIEWSDVPNVSNANGAATFQAILKLNTTGGRSGDIYFNYPDLVAGTATQTEGSSSSVGIKNSGTQPAGDPNASRLLLAQNAAAGTNAFVGTGKAIRLTATQATGTVFADDNGDGVMDAGEDPVPFAHLYRDGNNNGVLDGGENAVFADANGVYSMTSLFDGDNIIRINHPDIINTQPNPSVNLLMGEAGTNRHVGVFDTALVGTAGADSLDIAASGNRIDITQGTSGLPTYTILSEVLTKLSWDGLGGGDDVSVTAGPSLKLVGSEVLDVLTISNGSSAFMPAGTSSLLQVNSLVIDGTSTLDLNDNDMIVDYPAGSVLGDVVDAISNARNGGAWDGAGITSTAAKNNALHNTTLGAIEGSDYPGGLFNGVAVPSGSVLVKYTYYGDTDFNGEVNFDDYSRTDAGFNSGATGWFNGDFDGNNDVDFDDYGLIDLAFNSQGAPL